MARTSLSTQVITYAGKTSAVGLHRANRRGREQRLRTFGNTGDEIW